MSFQVVWRTDLKVDLNHTKLLRGVISPISTPNSSLNTVFDDVVSLCESRQKQCPPTVSTGKALTCCNSLAACEKTFLTRKEYACYLSRGQRVNLPPLWLATKISTNANYTYSSFSEIKNNS